MAKEDKQFEWYVLNDCKHLSTKFDDQYPFDRGDIKPWNIFNNGYVNAETNKLCRKYKKDKMSFTDFTEELRKIIMYEEWSRCEYEIMVGGLFSKESNYQKIDCYSQVFPNMEQLSQYVLRTYYPKITV